MVYPPPSNPLSCAVTANPNLSKARGFKCSSVKSNLRTTTPSRAPGPGALTRISPTTRLVTEPWEVALASLSYQICLALVGRYWGLFPVTLTLNTLQDTLGTLRNLLLSPSKPAKAHRHQPHLPPRSLQTRSLLSTQLPSQEMNILKHSFFLFYTKYI